MQSWLLKMSQFSTLCLLQHTILIKSTTCVLFQLRPATGSTWRIPRGEKHGEHKRRNERRRKGGTERECVEMRKVLEESGASSRARHSFLKNKQNKTCEHVRSQQVTTTLPKLILCF